jgi:thymidylate kinase
LINKKPQKPLKIFFAGIDGSGKSACLDLLISRLNKHSRILKIGAAAPELFWQGKKETIVGSTVYRLVGNATVNENHRLRGIFVIFRFVSNFFVRQYVRLRDKSDIVMCETDTVLHPSVYVTYYHPWTRKLNNSLRFALLNRLFGPRKNSVIFYLDTDPAIAMERIRRRNTTFDRHENIDDLQALKKQLDDMVDIAVKSGMEICKIDTNNKPLETICEDVERVLTNRFFLSSSVLFGVLVVGPAVASCIHF